MANCELRQQCVDRADLNASTPASTSKFSGLYVIRSICNQQRQCAEPINNDLAGARAGESLEQFLKNESRGNYRLAAVERRSQGADFRGS